MILKKKDECKFLFLHYCFLQKEKKSLSYLGKVLY